MSTRRVCIIIGVQIRCYQRLQWFTVFYGRLHSIHAGFIDNLSLESIVGAFAWGYVNDDAGFVAFGGSVGQWVSGSVGQWVSGSVGRGQAG